MIGSKAQRGWHIGVLGGSGLYDPGVLDDAQEIAVRSAFGEPSGSVVTGMLEGVRFTFMARHGAGHRLSPSHVNYRANVDVMKRCGVTDLVAMSAVGSLVEELPPGTFALVDQFIDRTVGRERSFFGEGITAHVGFADPACPRLSAALADGVQAAGGAVEVGATYVAIEGPQFSTRAESRLYKAWGAHVIGMTAMPEARLAREAELPYALVGMVTDYDAWREAEAGVDTAEILQTMQANADLARASLRAFAKALPKKRALSPIDTALDGAIVTPQDQWNPESAARLDAVARRILQ